MKTGIMRLTVSLLVGVSISAFSVADPFVPAGKLKTSPNLPAVQSQPVKSSITPPVTTLPVQLTGNQVAGKISFLYCGARASDVTILLNGVRQAAQIGPHPHDEFAYRYVLSNVSAGSYRLSAQLRPGLCNGGAWQPAARNITLRVTGALNGLDFHYRVTPTVSRINTGLVAAAMQGAFRGTQVHLNNYGARHGNSWHKANDSFIKLGAALGGGEMRFDIPEARKTPWRYYINDMNLSRIDVSPNGTKFRISMHFENSGKEVKGRCAASGAAGIPCLPGSDASAPDFQVNNARLDVDLTPAIYGNGSLAYRQVNTNFSASVDGNGIGELIDDLVKRKVKSNIEQFSRRALDQHNVRARVAEALRSTLEGFRIGSIVGVRIEGNDLVIEHLPRG